MRLRVALPLLLASTLAAGCGGATIDPVARAADATQKAGSEKVSMTATMRLAGQTIRMTGAGAFDSASRRGELGLDVVVPGRAGKTHIDEILDRSVIYMKPPKEVTRQLPGGKAWLKLDLQKAGSELGVNFQQLAQINQGDPSQMLQYLRASSGGVRKLGTESVRGVQTTRYEAVIDLEKVPKVAPQGERPQVRRAVDRLIQLTGVRKYPMEVWVDADDLVRRMRLALRFPTLGDSSLSLTADLYGFGTPVEAKPPPADQVLDIANLTSDTP